MTSLPHYTWFPRFKQWNQTRFRVRFRRKRTPRVGGLPDPRRSGLHRSPLWGQRSSLFAFCGTGDRSHSVLRRIHVSEIIQVLQGQDGGGELQ